MRVSSWFRKEPISWVDGRDAEMAEAIHQAQSTFQEFASALEEDSRRIVPMLDQALVKYVFPATKSGVEVEHLFLSNIEKKGDSLFGVVASDPVYTDIAREGERIEIDPSRVSDWLYVVNGVGVGGYTFRVLWSRFSEREKSRYGDQPPFVWVRRP